MITRTISSRGLGAFFLCTLLATLIPLQSGCQNRKVKVEIAANGEETTRTFATNQTERKELDQVAAVYGSEGTTDAELGRRFTGVFAEDEMPSEIGNRGAIGRLDSSLGSSRAYYEQFAPRREEWKDFSFRAESGILWVRLVGMYLERKEIKDPAAREQFSAWWNGEVVPLVADSYLMYSGMQAAVQAQRIGAMPRKREEIRARTPDEMFALEVFEPLALLFADRGLLTASELAAIHALGMKGHISKQEQTWAIERVLARAVERLAHRFAPLRDSSKLASFGPMVLGFTLWINFSREYRDLVLESPAISEAVKAEIRAGKWNFELPPPFGLRLGANPKVTDAVVVLNTGAKPFFSNGRWNDATQRVEFNGGFYESKFRYAPYNSPYYAYWSLPSQRQESVFGAVVIEGEALASYCGWEAALTDEQRVRWITALDQVAATKDATSAFAMIEELVEVHPLPTALAAWFADAVGKPLPARYTENESAHENDDGADDDDAPVASTSIKPNANAHIPEA